MIAGWRLALRLAWREALRSRARSLLIVVMIALPVTGVVAADVLIRTGQISAVEGEDRFLGHTAAARVAIETDRLEQQTVDPFGDNISYAGDKPRHTIADVKTLLGADRTYTSLVSTNATVPTTDGSAEADVQEYDPAQPLTNGLDRLVQGRWPSAPGELVVNPAYAAHGAPVGSSVTLPTASGGSVRRTVVGVAVSPLTRGGYVVIGLPGSVPLPSDCRCTSYLVSGGPVSWAQVGQLNRIGAMVLSRAVVADPPDLSRYATSDPVTPTVIAIALMIVVMGLLEVVLLAGPAIAVGAKRQSRSLALISASGGTPAQSRRTILASGIVLGASASALGLALGVGLARLGEPILQGHVENWLGPFDVRPLEVLGIAAFGLLSALLAAVVPAWIASKQDVVAVLAGRRGDRRPSLRTPVLGLITLALGIAIAYAGTRSVETSGAVMISASALICVLGMIMLVPVVLVAVAWLGARLPLPLRFAVRDAARHRARTVPAVAAVAAVVAGAVTLGIAMESDQARNAASYFHALPIGQAEINSAGQVDWTATEATVRSYAPRAKQTLLRAASMTGHPDTFFDVTARAPGGDSVEPGGWSGYGPSGSGMLVSDGSGALPYPEDVTAGERTAAQRTLARGGVVVFTAVPVDGATVRLGITPEGGSGPNPKDARSLEVPAYYLADQAAPASVIAPPAVAARLGLTVSPAALWLTGRTIDGDTAQRMNEALTKVSGQPSLYVERGYEATQGPLVLEMVLIVLTALLMLGGTLTTTFLALSDARPDLATLAAVGAAPRLRRLVGAAYALSLGFVGAVLGLLVGLVPGIALSYPITSSGWRSPGSDAPSHFLVVPWGLLAAVVFGVPLVVALLVGLCTRSRLPLVARLT